MLTLKAEHDVLSSGKEGCKIVHTVQSHLCKICLCVDIHVEVLVDRLKNVYVSYLHVRVYDFPPFILAFLIPLQ